MSSKKNKAKSKKQIKKTFPSSRSFLDAQRARRHADMSSFDRIIEEIKHGKKRIKKTIKVKEKIARPLKKIKKLKHSNFKIHQATHIKHRAHDVQNKNHNIRHVDHTPKREVLEKHNRHHNVHKNAEKTYPEKEIKKGEESETGTKPLEKHPELLEDKETLHDLVTMPTEVESEEKETAIVKSQASPVKEIKIKKAPLSSVSSLNTQSDSMHADITEPIKEPAKKEESETSIEEIEKEERKEGNSFSKMIRNMFSHHPKTPIPIKVEVKEKNNSIEIAQKKEIKKVEETQENQVTVSQEKLKGDVIDAYTIKVDGASADIRILKTEIGTRYTINIPKISAATTALINDLREELIAITSVSMQELIDPKAFASIKKKFKEEAAKLIRKKIPTIKEETESFLVGTLMQEMLGIGKIEYLINDPNLEEIVIVSAKEPIKVFSKKYGWLSTSIILEKEEITINYSNIIARRVGRQITVLSPLLDAHLVTGDRVNAVLYPINTKGNTIVIRKFARDPYTIIDLINNKTCDLDSAALMWLAVEYEMNVIISGGTASGKTVLLNACMPFIPPNQRIISIEDTKELALPDFLYWTPLVTRLPNAEGKGAVTMLDLLINSLRMRPDRIILGEMRKHEEAMVLFEAMHTGHSVYATLHADSAAETISRLTHPPLDIPANLLQAIHLNVVMFRDRRRGIRRVLQIAEIEVEGDSAKANTLYRWSPESDKLVKHSKSSKFFEEISRHTSMTEEEINKEINLKKKILSWLIDHKIRKLDDLGKTINLYYQNKELLLKKIAKNDINFILNYEK